MQENNPLRSLIIIMIVIALMFLPISIMFFHCEKNKWNECSKIRFCTEALPTNYTLEAFEYNYNRYPSWMGPRLIKDNSLKHKLPLFFSKKSFWEKWSDHRINLQKKISRFSKSGSMGLSSSKMALNSPFSGIESDFWSLSENHPYDMKSQVRNKLAPFPFEPNPVSLNKDLVILICMAMVYASYKYYRQKNHKENSE